MKIKKVIVQKLFGLYDYDLNFRDVEKVTIIHGPNGTGKTSVLQLINAVIVGDVYTLDTIPFLKVEIHLDTDHIIKVSKARNYQSVFDLDIETYYELNRKEGHRLILPISYEVSHMTNIASELHKVYFSKEELDRAFRRLARSNYSDTKRYSIAEAIGLESGKNAYFYSDELAELLSFFIGVLPIKLIKANRVFKVKFEKTDDRRRFSLFDDEDDRLFDTKDTVEQISDGIKKQIEEARREKEITSNRLDRTFPKRVIALYNEHGNLYYDSNDIVYNNAYDIIKRYSSNGSKIAKLEKLGIIEKEEQVDSCISFSDMIGKKHDIAWILDLYGKDTEEKYSVFDKLIEKLELYQSIFSNSMPFQNKHMVINAEKGVYFVSNNGSEVPLNKLSSGEKNALLLFYELIFNCDKNTVLLIDEPEISLHISWQVEYINILLKICEMRDIQAIVATHSPNIVDEHFDLLEDMIKE